MFEVTITEFMTNDHRRCDDLFSTAEELIAKEEWEKGGAAYRDFYEAIEHHFKMEEEVLFPSFEQETGSTAGPTMMMRHEHQQMKELFSAMAKAVLESNQDSFLGNSETLLIIMQQHNMKEEQMLYPMASNALEDKSEEVLQQLQSI